MNRTDYERYLECFNARDYDAVLDHFAGDFTVEFAGYCFRGREAVKRFYEFFHDYVDESIELQAFACSDELLAIEAVVRLRARQHLTAERLAEEGLDRLVSLAAGEGVALPQFIHYHLRGGKFVRAACVVSAPPSPL